MKLHALLITLAVCASASAALAGTPVTHRAPGQYNLLVPSTHAPDRQLLSPTGVPATNAVTTTGGTPNATLMSYGKLLFSTHCVTCHGADLKGTANGPSLLHAGGAAVNFFLTTGRMPASISGVQSWHSAPLFEQHQIEAIQAYVTAHAQQTVPIPNVRRDPAKLQHGRRLFADNCEQCHGAAAQGAIVGSGWIAPALGSATPTQIGEAIRIGPGEMPRFTAAMLSNDDIDAIATWVTHLNEHPENPGGTPFDFLGPTVEGLIAWTIGIGGLFLVIYFTGTTAQGARLNERNLRKGRSLD